MVRSPSFWTLLLRAVNPIRLARPSPARQVATKMTTSLVAGTTVGVALRDTSRLLAAVAVRQAVARFEGGVAALFIVEVRDALIETLRSAGRKLSRQHERGGLFIATTLCGVAASLTDESVEQHLINLVLGVAGLPGETAVLSAERVDLERLELELATLLRRLISTRLDLTSLTATLRDREPCEAVTDATVLAGEPRSAAGLS